LKVLAVSKRTLILFLLTIYLVGYLNVGCSADLAYLMSVDEMTEKADVILVGTVESVSHHPADPNDVPKMHRRVLVSVERDLKNPEYSSKVTILVLGATIGNTTLWVEDQPEFNVSERVLLFLREDPWFLEENPNGYYQVLGECQGKFTVEGESAISELGLVVHDGDEFHGIKFALEAATPPLPPILSDLTITPAEIEIGYTVTVRFDIENIDSQAFVYTVATQVGNLTGLIDIELEAYESKTVSRVITHGITIPSDIIGIIHVQVGGLTGSFEVKTPPLKPAEFEFSNFEITPKEVELGMRVTVSVDVTNVGEEMGGYTVELKLDGEVVDSKEIPPFGGVYPDFDRVTASVSFGVKTGVFATPQGDIERREGTYQVEVEGLTGSFTVKPESSSGGNIPGFPYESIIIGLVVVIIIFWYALARKF